MAHAGQELALGPIGTLSLLLSFAHGLLRFSGLGDVFGDSKQERRLTGRVEDRDLFRVQDACALVLGLDHLLANWRSPPWSRKASQTARSPRACSSLSAPSTATLNTSARSWVSAAGRR